jgi:hypothetical protein
VQSVTDICDGKVLQKTRGHICEEFEILCIFQTFEKNGKMDTVQSVTDICDGKVLQKRKGAYIKPSH